MSFFFLSVSFLFFFHLSLLSEALIEARFNYRHSIAALRARPRYDR